MLITRFFRVSKSRIIRGAGHVERIGEGGGAYWFGEKKTWTTEITWKTYMLW